MDPIIKGGGVQNCQTIKLTKISKMASGIECKGEPVTLALIVLTSDDIIDGEIVMESSFQDCKSPMYAPKSLIVQNLGVVLTPKCFRVLSRTSKTLDSFADRNHQIIPTFRFWVSLWHPKQHS